MKAMFISVNEITKTSDLLSLMSLVKTLLSIYYSLFHIVMNYGIIFWGNSYHSIKTFRMQESVIRIIMGCGNRDSCRNIFKKLKILPLMSQYVLSLLIFVVNNRDQFLINSEIHNINTRHRTNLHLPLANLDIYQRGVYYSGIKIFNILPFKITNISDNPRTFKMALKICIYQLLLFIRDFNNNKYILDFLHFVKSVLRLTSIHYLSIYLLKCIQYLFNIYLVYI